MGDNVFAKYRYVYEVYKEKSFTNAAKKLFISQPSLSAAIKRLEENIGAPLFERGATPVTLTEIGKEYISAAERIMSIESEFENRINDIYGLETGSISVGGSNYLSSYVLPEIVNRFTTLYPNIEVTLTEANSTVLCDMVNKEQLDIVMDSYDESSDLYDGVPLLNERILLCVPLKCEINAKLKKFQINPDDIYNNEVELDTIPSVSIKEFENEKFILLKSGNDMHKRAMDIFHRENMKPEVLFSVDQLNISYILAEAGMGVCFATDTLFKYGKFHKNVVLYKVGEGQCSRTLYIAHKKNKYCSNAMREFINIAKEVVKK